jgi:hypothetical protein
MLLIATPAQADDLEAGLLRKFQQQSEKAALQAKLDVEKTIARAFALSPTEPESALEMLRRARELLESAEKLQRAEKEALLRKLNDGLSDAKARLESQAAAEKARRAETLVKPASIPPATTEVTEPKFASARKLAVSPIVAVPNIVPVQSQAQAQVTPIVSADRRWVRINLSGSFFMFR